MFGDIGTVVVTGGNGYVGSSLIRHLLHSGVQVHAFANENHQRLDSLLPPAHVHLLEDGLDGAAEIVKRIQPDVIFHLAAVYAEPTQVSSILSMVAGNISLGVTMLHAATLCAVPPAFVNTGTYWQFGPDGSYMPNTLYAATKQGFQDILAYYRARHHIPSTTLTLYDVFGADDDRPKLWNKITRCQPRTHIPLSNGTQEIHLVHIDDVVDAFMVAARHLCSGDAMSAMHSVHADERPSLRSLLDAFNAQSELELSFGWGELPTWEGVIQTPWTGERLAGWSVRRPALPELMKMVARGRGDLP